MRATRSYTYLGTVRGMCRRCRRLVPGRILEEGGAVYQERLCPSCGAGRARIADRASWYFERMRAGCRPRPVRMERAAGTRGCPFDCGPCRFHAAACHLPVFSVTNACDLRCPICFTYNRPDRRWFMGREELRALLDRAIERAGPFDLANITGGEPTLHPGLIDLVDECRRPGIGRVTVNSNGLRLAADRSLCAELAGRGAHCILSLHTLRPETSRRLHGRDLVAGKLRALDNLERAGVGVTILAVLARGVNEDEIGDIARLVGAHSGIRSLTIQTMAFTGQGGKDFLPRRHLPLDGAARALERGTGGEIRESHFVPHPGAHPLCYSVACYFRGPGGLRSFTDLLEPAELREMLGGGYLLDPEGRPDLFRAAIDRAWSRGGGDGDGLLRRAKDLLGRIYPPGKALPRAERQRAAEGEVLAVYIHSHMDEDTLDLGRLAACPDQVPDSAGRLVPACAYNLFGRMEDPRFCAEADVDTETPTPRPAGTQGGEP